MRDIQNEEDTREVPLQKVGVKNVKYPVMVFDKEKKHQNTIMFLATWSLIF